jgi:hypothetical protein
MKHVKMLGVAAVAAMAVMALVGVASASAFTNFNGESAPVRIEGTQSETAKFKTSAGTIECSSGTFKGESAVATTETIESSFAYGGCKFLGFINVTVVPNGCKYLFHASGSADVVNCESGKTITFTAAGCTVSVGAQTGLSPITYENVGSGKTATVNVLPTVTNIVYSTNSSCPGGARTNETGGEYTKGKTSVKGFKGTSTTQQGIFMS